MNVESKSTYAQELDAFYDAVDRLQKELPKMAEQARHANLSQEFEQSLGRMNELVSQIERVFSMINMLSATGQNSQLIPVLTESNTAAARMVLGDKIMKWVAEKRVECLGSNKMINFAPDPGLRCTIE